MKVRVNCTNLCATASVVLKKGVSYIDEEKSPALAKRVKELLLKFPEDIVEYDGPTPGVDVMGVRSQEEFDAQMKAAEAERQEKKAAAEAAKEEAPAETAEEAAEEEAAPAEEAPAEPEKAKKPRSAK